MAMKEPPSRLFSKMTIKGKDGTSSRSKELNSEYPDLKEFELLDTLGTGTFGRVRLCRHSKQDKYFALKILKKNEIIRLKQVEHIISEKQILGKVDHPFIVKLYVRRRRTTTRDPRCRDREEEKSQHAATQTRPRAAQRTDHVHVCPSTCLCVCPCTTAATPSRGNAACSLACDIRVPCSLLCVRTCVRAVILHTKRSAT